MIFVSAVMRIFTVFKIKISQYVLIAIIRTDHHEYLEILLHVS